MFPCNPQESREGAMPFREGRFGLDSGITLFISSSLSTVARSLLFSGSPVAASSYEGTTDGSKTCAISTVDEKRWAIPFA